MIISMMNVINKESLKMGENYFPEIKKIKKELEKEELKRWAKSLSLKNIHKPKNKNEKRIIKVKKDNRDLKMKIALLQSALTPLLKKLEEEKHIFPSYSGLYKMPNFKIPISTNELEKEKSVKLKELEGEEEGEELEGLVISFNEDNINNIIINENEIFEKSIKEKFNKIVEEQKINKKIEENPFMEYFKSSSLKKEKEEKKESAKIALKKLFA